MSAVVFSQVIYDHEIVASAAEEVIVGTASQRLIFLASAWDDGRNDSEGKTGSCLGLPSTEDREIWTTKCHK